MNDLTLSLIILGALGDSINPCAIAVLIFLVTFLISVKKRGKQVLTIGIIYVICVYLTYFIAGLGLLSLVKGLEITRLVYKISAIVVILAGLINIKEFLLEGKGFSLAIPSSKKPIIKKYIQRASIPAAIILGVLVSIFELPCTGGIYVAIIGLLAEKATLSHGRLYLLFYNLIFVLPLIIIVLIAYFGLSSETINAWRKRNQKLLRLIMGIVMIVLGVMMFAD